ncbi:unnamed protein product [Alopecurus aequalis]
MACVVEEEEDDFFIEPFFYDEAELFAEMEAAEEARLRKEEEKARKEAERQRRAAAHRAVMDSILERDPKTGREVYTRYSFNDFSKFDIDEESCIPPMRFTNTGYRRDLNLEDSANILSIKIVSSDRGFPINVYGTIIARDSVDHKCIYLFKRSREDYQTINSEDDRLILTGPGRGLVLLDFIYLEINLKIKIDEEPLEQQISKGLLSIDGRVQPRDEKVNVGSQTLKSWFSAVKVNYATILNAVEATFEIKVLKKHFRGEITVGMKGVEEKIVIHDSTKDGMETRGDKRFIKLRRHVMTIRLDSMLIFEFDSKGCRNCGGAPEVIIEKFTPLPRTHQTAKVNCATGRFEVKVVWSLMDISGRVPVGYNNNKLICDVMN